MYRQKSSIVADAGTYPIHLRVSDNNGGTADQTYILSVLPTGINYPPYFTSTPVLNANINTPYTYQSAAADLDNDTHTFSLVSGPPGMTVEPTGLVQWTPDPSVLAGQPSVTVPVRNMELLSRITG